MDDQTGLSNENLFKSLEDGIARCDKNIEIFSAEVEKQRALKIELEIQFRELKTKMGKP